MRAARTAAAAARLEAEVGARLLERLDYVKLAPHRILDAGSGGAREARPLAARYAGSAVIALDYALPVLPRPRRFARWLRRGALAVCGDFVRLPLAAASVELVWSNLALHWAAEPLAVLREFERVLVPGGLVLFSTLGPDTLQELRRAAGERRVHAFLDMHDIGDMLVEAGFTAPVMEMERITMRYESGEQLLADLRSSGQTNARVDRPRGLAGRGFLRAFRGLPLQATYEVVYGHAWKRPDAAPRADADVKTVRVFKRIP